MEELSNLPPSAPQKPYGQNKSLAIALAVSAVFLLAAAGIAYWMLTKSAGAPSTQKPTGDGSENVKNISWVAPATIPGTYVRRDQNIQNTATTYYFDAAAGCGITTTVQPVQANVAIKQGVLDAAKAAQAYGIATSSSTDAKEVSVQNQDSKTYTFAAVQLEQNVAVAGVPYTAQRTVTAFKQFGQHIATISHSCRSDVWDAKSAELQPIVSAFKVKTE